MTAARTSFRAPMRVSVARVGGVWMGQTVILAQANGPQGPNPNPAKVITVNKPQGDQSITLHLDGSTKLDLSTIANENITLIHIGDRLIILFDNHAQVTIEPFSADNGQPLPDLTIELGPNHDVSAAQFATDFPITTDQSVLPASGGPNSVSSGANFVSFTLDTFTTPTPLPLLAAETLPGTSGGPNTETPQHIVPMSLETALSSGSVSEGGLVTDTIGTTGNSHGAAITATGVPGSLDALVNFGSGGANAAPFQFVAATAANQWLASLGLSSHGAAIDTATITGDTLVAGTDAAQGTPHNVFSLTINADGSWTFTLLAPLDDAPGQGANSLTIDLSGLVQAVDAAGLTITLSGDFKITVVDDIPELTGQTASGGVDEGALAVASGTPGDLYGSGNDQGHEGASTVVTGSLSGLVSFGADGPETVTVHNVETGTAVLADGFQFAVGNNSTHDFAVTSHGQQVNFVTLSSTSDGADGVSQTLTAWTNGGPGGENNSHEVFTLTLNGDGSYTFTLINPLDDPSGQAENSVTLDLSGLVQASDFDGDAVMLSGDFKITVTDDVPVLTGSASSGSVDEGGLKFGLPIISAGDFYGSGNDHGAATSAGGSLASLVSFGADGPQSGS